MPFSWPSDGVGSHRRRKAVTRPPRTVFPGQAGRRTTAGWCAGRRGGGLVLTAVGVPRASQCESVRLWKQGELTRPFVSFVFGRLKLQNAIGRIGSVRARLVVVTVFLVALLVPLQSALNQLTVEFRTRQAISRALAVFDLPGRSAVIHSSFTLNDDEIDVRIQVATNELFAARDIVRFEERVLDQVGRRTRLDLVRTLSELGEGGRISRMLSARGAELAPVRELSIGESLQKIRGLVSSTVAALPLPETARVLGARGALSGGGGPAIELSYLADRELGTDARAILARLFTERTGIDQERLT